MKVITNPKPERSGITIANYDWSARYVGAPAIAVSSDGLTRYEVTYAGPGSPLVSIDRGGA